METPTSTELTPKPQPQPTAKRAPPKRFIRQQIPDSILNDHALKSAMEVLPSNYSLEIPKTIWRIRQSGAKRVALQFPEGLLMFALTISDIVETFTDAEETFVLGDVTYGACCVDDYSAVALGADFLVHYGHSCLVPVDHTLIPCLYIFVEIGIDIDHFVETLRYNFKKEEKIALAGTIQFSSAIHTAKETLQNDYSSLVIPQAKPLSAGEVLGCTAPTMPKGSVDTAIFVADGRFHLEAFMIANPSVRVYRYDPYLRVLIHEEYDHIGMKDCRRRVVENARNGKEWGIVLGTLGRQGNPRILAHLEGRLKERGISWTVFLLSEISPAKIVMFEDSVDVWVQIACPRLSIDWGEAFVKPMLTPFEAEVALGFVQPWWTRERGVWGSRGVSEGDKDSCGKVSCCGSGGCGKEEGEENSVGKKNGDKAEEIGEYPMDYYARDGGPWNSSYAKKISVTK